jgi:hypothetical protein
MVLPLIQIIKYKDAFALAIVMGGELATAEEGCLLWLWYANAHSSPLGSRCVVIGISVG